MTSPPEPDSSVDTAYCVGCNLRVNLSKLCPGCGGTVIFTPNGGLADFDTDDDRPQDSQSLVGTDLDRYSIELLLGTGGMGSVYLARHRDLLRHCALKILLPHPARSDVDCVERFQAEGQAAAALVNPNVVTTHAVGEADGFWFLEMEFVAGGSLQHLLVSDSTLSISAATRLALDIAAGLAEAHRHGIVHRDLKPDNVMLTERGEPKIGDFGLAKLVHDHADTSLCGTPHYMAPELFLGQGAHTGSDVYALGVCYYRLISRRFPFTGSTLGDLQHQVTTSELPAVEHPTDRVPLEVASAVQALMSKSPEVRPSDADAAVSLLEAVLGAIRDVGELLELAVADDAAVESLGDPQDSRWTLKVAQPDGRRQRVLVELSEPESLVSIYSTCCPAQSDFDRRALERNGHMDHGSIAVRSIDDTPHFVVINSYPRATVDVEELRRSVHEVARQADRVERELTESDIH